MFDRFASWDVLLLRLLKVRGYLHRPVEGKWFVVRIIQKNTQDTDTLEDNQLITGHGGQQDVQTSSDENNEHLKRRRPQRRICLMVMTVKMFVCFHRLNFDFQKKCIIMSSN